MTVSFSRRWLVRLAMWLGVLVVGAHATGCAACKNVFFDSESVPDTAPAADSSVCQIAATWQNQVYYTPDTTQNGATTPQLVGRLYLFGPDTKHSLVGNGSLVVDLFDERDLVNGQPKHLEQWKFDKVTLQKLLHRDPVGWGYTVMLPWSTCRPEVAQVTLKTCYQTEKGMAVYSPSAPMTVTHGDRLPGMQNLVARLPLIAQPAQQIQPVAAQQPAPPARIAYQPQSNQGTQLNYPQPQSNQGTQPTYPPPQSNQPVSPPVQRQPEPQRQLAQPSYTPPAQQMQQLQQPPPATPAPQQRPVLENVPLFMQSMSPLQGQPVQNGGRPGQLVPPGHTLPPPQPSDLSVTVPAAQAVPATPTVAVPPATPTQPPARFGVAAEGAVLSPPVAATVEPSSLRVLYSSGGR